MAQSGNIFSGFDFSQFQGVAEDPGKVAKQQSKSQKQLAKMQGKIQKEIVEMQAKYAAQQQAQAIQGQVQLQQGQQGYQRPFDEAEVTGRYNGQGTFQREQWTHTAAMEAEQMRINQQNQEFEKMNMALDAEIQRGSLDLARLQQQNQNAIAQGNLALAQQTQAQIATIQNRQADLEDKKLEFEHYKQARAEEQFNKKFSMDESSVTGTYNGQETQQAKAQKAALAMEQGALTGVYINPETGEQMSTQQAKEFAASHGLDTTRVMGVDAQGNMTDAAQQWRTNSALEYAKTAAQLAQNPQDYFESAAFMRGAQASGATGFLDAINQNGLGSNMGFRSAQSGLPQVGSMQSVAAGNNTVPMGGPSASVDQAQRAVAGQPVAYTESMNRPPSPQLGDERQMYAGGGTGVYGTEAQNRLNAFAPTFQAGAHKLAPGALESMSATEKGLFSSAAKASGINPQDFESAYKRSRLQTNVGASTI